MLVTLFIVLVALVGVVWANAGRKAEPSAIPVRAADIPTAPVEQAPASPEPASPKPPEGESSIPVGTKANQRAPDFELATLEGERQSLSDFRGKVVLLNFWATWCAPCRMEMPDIKAVYAKHKDGGFVVLAVNIGEASDAVSKFAKQFGLDFPIMQDSKTTVARQYGLFSIPTSFFLDRQGVIRTVRMGTMRESYIDQVVSQLLKGS